jgi:hypothetical protein
MDWIYTAYGVDAPRAFRRRSRRGPLLRSVGELDDPGVRRERVSRVPGARVVLADYELLQHDFPELRDDALERAGLGLHHGADRAAVRRRLIDEWLLERAAVVSQAQARQSTVNTPISTTDKRRFAWRPTAYGRALVVEAGADGGLLDLKGIGVAPRARPSDAMHSSGLCDLGEVLRDMLFQWAIDAIFEHAGVELGSVPTYAAIDLGFDRRLHDGRLLPAGVQVRRAHRRPVDNADIPVEGRRRSS